MTPGVKVSGSNVFFVFLRECLARMRKKKKKNGVAGIWSQCGLGKAMDGDTVYEAALQAWPPWRTDTLQNRKVAASAGVSAR